MDIEKKRETNQVRNSENWVLFYYLLYSITFACLLILLWRLTKFSILDECLILLIPPILYFSYHFTRFYYVSASVIFYLTCIGTLYIIGGAFVTQSQTATIFILTILLTSEVIYRSRKRELATVNKLNDLNSSYRALFGNAVEMIHIIDDQGYIIDSNQSELDQLGYTKKEYIGKHLLEIVHPDYQERTREKLNQVLQGEKIQNYRNRLLTKTGREMDVEVNAIPKVVSGKVESVMGIVRDITGKSRLDEELRMSEERYRTLVENTSDSVWKIAPDGMIIFASHSVRKMFGFEPSEVTGQPIDLILDNESAALARESIQQRIDGKFGDQGISMELICTRKDATKFNAEIRTTPLFDENGRLKEIIGVARDITERKQKEQELRFQSMLLDQIQDAITATDLEGNITYVNQAQCMKFEKTREELIGQHVQLYGEDSARGATQKEIIETTLAQGEWSGEIVNYRDDGQEIIFDCRVQLVRDDKNQPVGMVGINTDITKRKQAEEALRESENSLSALLNASPESAFLIDTQGVVLNCNRVFADRMGLQSEDLIDHCVYDFLPPEIASVRRKHMEEVIHSGKPHHFEDIRKGIYFSSYSAPIPNDLGQVSRLAIFAHDITQYKQTEDTLQKERNLSNSIRAAQDLFISGEDPRKVYQELLHILVESTNSEYGFLDEVLFDSDGSPYKLSLALSAISWDDDSHRIYKELVERNLEFRNLDNLAGAPVLEGKTIIANEAPQHPRFRGIPPGHPSITSFMGIPLFFAGKIIGVAGVANRPEGYTEEIAEFVRPLTQTCGAMIWAERLANRDREIRNALKASEEKYRQIAETAHEGIWVIDTQQRTTYVNHRMTEMLGYKKEEMLGRQLSSFMLPEDLADHEEQMTLRVNGQDSVYERRFKRKDGSILWANVSATAQHDQQGDFVGSFAMLTDITDRKKIENELRSSEEKFSKAFHNAPILMVISSFKDGRCLDVNDTFVRFTGYSRDQTIGATSTELGLLKSKDREMFFTLLEAEGRVKDLELDFTRADGSTGICLYSAELIEMEGQSYILSLATDITEKKAAERSKHLMEYCIENASVSIFWITPEGRFLHVNKKAAEELGYPLEELIGKNVHDVDPNYPEEARQAHWERQKKEGTLIFETKHQTSSGKTIYREVIGHYINYEEEELEFAFAQDITARKQAEFTLQKSEARLRALWSVASLSESNFKTICDHVLQTIVEMTGSQFGFYGFLNADETVMTIHSWNGAAMEQCTMVDKPVDFPIGEAGVWAEAIRHRKPFILNDYPASHPAKMGLPDGHVPLTNLLVVPYIASGKIISVAGVANCRSNYNQDDVSQVTSFLTSVNSVVNNKRAETALQESEARLKSIYDGAMDGFLLADPKTEKFLDANHAMCQMLGYSHAELLELSVKDIHPEDSVEYVLEQFRKQVNGEIQLAIDMPVKRKDGSVFYADINCSLLTINDIQGAMGIFRDVTQRKQTEEALRKSEALLDATGRMARVGGWEVDIQTLEVQWTNETYRIHEVPMDHIPPLEEAINFFHPGDRDRLSQAIQRSIDHGEPYDMELRFINAKGNELWTRTICQPQIKDGKTVKLIGSFQDITDRKRAEEREKETAAQLRLTMDELREKHNLLEMITTTSPVAITFVDIEGRINFANSEAETLLGLTQDKITKRAYNDPEWRISDPKGEDFPEEQLPFNIVRRTGMPVYEIEHAIEFPGGRRVLLSINAAPLKDLTGSVIGMVAALTDITERRRAEETLLHETRKMKLAADSAGIGVWDLDIVHNRLTWDHWMFQLYGISPENFEDVYEEWQKGVHPEDLERVNEEVEAAVKEGQEFDTEFRIIRPDGDIRYIKANALVIEDEEGNPVRMIGINYDITERKQAEESLRESERQKNIILNSTSEMVAYYNLDLRVIWANRAAGESVGKTKKELVGLHCYEIWGQRSEPCEDCPVLKARDTKTPQQSDTQTPDGRFWHIRGYPVLNEKGAVTALVEFGLDTTERKKAEIALRESERQFHEIVDHMASGVAVYEAIDNGNDFTFKDINIAGCRIGKRTREDHIGKSIHEMYPSVKEMGIFDALQRVWRTGKPETLPLTQYEDDIIQIWVENYLFKLPSGEVIAVFDDITEQKRYEQELHDSESKFRTVADFTFDWEYWISPDGSVTYISPSCERISSYKPEEYINNPALIDKIVHPEDKEIWVNHRCEQEEKKTNYFIEFRIVRRDGNESWLEHVCQPVYDDNGKYIGYRASNRDITDRKQVEKERTELEKQFLQVQKLEALGTLAGGVAHDFNNILAGVMGFTQLAMNTDDREELKDNLQSVLEASKRAKNLVKQILAFSRKSETRKSSLAIAPVIKEAIKLLRSTLPSSIEIQQRIASEAAISADLNQIHQVIMNLCTNAAHAMRETGGILEIELRDYVIREKLQLLLAELKPGEYVRLSIRDTGDGIPEEIQTKIFDPFFTTKDKSEGAGLGLSVVLGIVKNHQGGIEFESTLGEGTAFNIYFPTSKNQEETVREDSSIVQGNQERILFADDEEMLRKMVGRMLETLGYRPVICHNGMEALETFRDSPNTFDLVLTDQTMPVMTGLNLSKEILKIRPAIPIILYTGYDERITPEIALTAGIKEMLYKPLTIEKLSQVLSKLLTKKSGNE